MADRLPGAWRRWQRECETAMMARGVSRATAIELAEREARARARAARVVGFKIALEAELHMTRKPDGGGIRTLLFDVTTLPPERREVVRRALGARRLS